MREPRDRLLDIAYYLAGAVTVLTGIALGYWLRGLL